MIKIVVQTHVVELDDDEMTRLVWEDSRKIFHCLQDPVISCNILVSK